MSITGGLGGFAGFLLANLTEFVSPAYMSWQESGELIVMVILGGVGTLDGAIIGTAAYLLAEEWLSGFTENWKVIFRTDSRPGRFVCARRADRSRQPALAAVWSCLSRCFDWKVCARISAALS